MQKVHGGGEDGRIEGLRQAREDQETEVGMAWGKKRGKRGRQTKGGLGKGEGMGQEGETQMDGWTGVGGMGRKRWRDGRARDDQGRGETGEADTRVHLTQSLVLSFIPRLAVCGPGVLWTISARMGASYLLLLQARDGRQVTAGKQQLGPPARPAPSPGSITEGGDSLSQPRVSHAPCHSLHSYIPYCPGMWPPRPLSQSPLQGAQHRSSPVPPPVPHTVPPSRVAHPRHRQLAHICTGNSVKGQCPSRGPQHHPYTCAFNLSFSASSLHAPPGADPNSGKRVTQARRHSSGATHQGPRTWLVQHTS